MRRGGNPSAAWPSPRISRARLSVRLAPGAAFVKGRMMAVGWLGAVSQINPELDFQPGRLVLCCNSQAWSCCVAGLSLGSLPGSRKNP